MVVLYYFDAGCGWWIADAADLEEWQAIALSVAGIALAWIVYDVLCRTVGQRSQVALAVVGTGARRPGRVGSRASSSRRAPRISRSA